MAKILEHLEDRVAAAKKRLDEATAVFQAAQQTLQSAQHAYNVWTLALQTEARDEQQRAAAAAEQQLPLPTAKVAPAIPTQPLEPVDVSEPANKTEIVRELLKGHPNGMSAIEIWKEVCDRFKYRPYLYSVLKRLRDRDEVLLRRKKYCLAPAKVEEVRDQPVVH